MGTNLRRDSLARRSRRQKLAAPVVATTATLGACIVHDAPVQPPQPAPVATTNSDPSSDNSPSAASPPVTTQEPPPVAIDPPELKTPTTPSLSPAPDNGRVFVREDGTCWWAMEVKCPPQATCNPPPPRQVLCPSDDSDNSTGK